MDCVQRQRSSISRNGVFHPKIQEASCFLLACLLCFLASRGHLSRQALQPASQPGPAAARADLRPPSETADSIDDWKRSTIRIDDSNRRSYRRCSSVRWAFIPKSKGRSPQPAKESRLSRAPSPEEDTHVLRIPRPAQRQAGSLRGFSRLCCAVRRRCR